MHLRLRELQAVVKNEMKKEKSSNDLREELSRVLGPSILVSKKNEYVYEAALQQLDLLEATSRTIGTFRTSVLIEASKMSSPAARRLAARLLPEKHAEFLAFDSNGEVRYEAAKRISYPLLREALKAHPSDHGLKELVRSRKRLTESGLPAPGEYVDSLEMYRKPMGDTVKTRALGELDDHWYEHEAQKICKRYAGNLEAHWEEIAATRHAQSHFLSTGVKVDRDKLLQVIKDILEERNVSIVGEAMSLKQMAKLLRESAEDDIAVMPIIEETKDPVKELLESNFGMSNYVSEAESLFSIRKSYLPSGIKKYRLGEGLSAEVQVPVLGEVPGKSIGANEERALDRYVDSWNQVQARSGEPYRLSWSPHPSGINLVGFNLELK